MPRIRTLKPEHRQHRKIGPLSHLAYRLWVGMICEADDEGRLVCDPKQLRALIFAYHPGVTVRLLEAGLTEIQATGLVRLYFVDGVRYADFPSWRDHQYIPKKQPSKLPEFKHSGNATGTLPDQDGNGTVRLPDEYGGIGKDWKGKEGIGPEGSLRETSDRPEQASAVLAFLNQKAGRSYRAVPANLDLITARLKDGIEPWQLKAVISRKVREWTGDAKMAKFLRPETLFGKTHCEQYIGELPAPEPEAAHAD